MGSKFTTCASIPVIFFRRISTGVRFSRQGFLRTGLKKLVGVAFGQELIRAPKDLAHEKLLGILVIMLLKKPGLRRSNAPDALAIAVIPPALCLFPENIVSDLQS